MDFYETSRRDSLAKCSCFVPHFGQKFWEKGDYNIQKNEMVPFPGQKKAMPQRDMVFGL